MKQVRVYTAFAFCIWLNGKTKFKAYVFIFRFYYHRNKIIWTPNWLFISFFCVVQILKQNTKRIFLFIFRSNFTFTNINICKFKRSIWPRWPFLVKQNKKHEKRVALRCCTREISQDWSICAVVYLRYYYVEYINALNYRRILQSYRWLVLWENK